MSRKKLRFQDNGHLTKSHAKADDWFDRLCKRRGRQLIQGFKPKTDGQELYIDAINNNDIILATGPAGCGKSYVAVGMAYEGLKEEAYKKIIAIRPCLGVGKTMGYLPGTIEKKVEPYLRPLLDGLGKFFTHEQIEQLIRLDILELGSIEHIRGRTLEDAFIILDEAQNCTEEEFSVFITRLGFGSKMVINGDISRHTKPGREGLYQQCDLKLQAGQKCAFEYQCENLKNIDGIEVVHLQPMDVVRHPVVKRIMQHGL